MSDPFIGMILPSAINWAPSGWAFCNGQTVSVQQYQALFSIVNTLYGGDGKTTFGLPNLQSYVPIHYGTGPGLTPRPFTTTGGLENVTLNLTEIPGHTHAAVGNDSANQMDPTGLIWGGDSTGSNPYYTNQTPSPTDRLQQGALSTAGGGANGATMSHDNMPPVLALQYVIALEGVYPITD
jgi:microcystin-dependent protein